MKLRRYYFRNLPLATQSMIVHIGIYVLLALCALAYYLFNQV